MFVDADDWIEPDMCRELVEKASLYQTDVVICNFDRPCSDGSLELPSDYQEEFIHITTSEERRSFLLKRREFSFSPMHLFHRGWFLGNHISFPEKLFYEDHVMFLVYALADRIYISNRRFYHYYRNMESTMGMNRNPLDRILVHLTMYPRLCEKRFFDIRDLVDYNFYDKGFCETIFYSAIHTNNPDLLSYLKKTLFSYIPDITSNPYYTRELTLSTFSAEFLLHPVLECDITPENFDLLRRRTFYCWEYPGAVVYLEQMVRLQRKLDTAGAAERDADFFQNISESLSKICRKYCGEAFAHKADAAAFCGKAERLCAVPSDGKELSDLLSAFCITITLPESDSSTYGDCRSTKEDSIE